MFFKKAERKKAKLRLALSGPSGSGKTFSALLVAKGIGGPVAMIDTESGSGELYAGNPKIGIEYDVMQFSPPYTPLRAVEAVQAAQKAGYNVVIFDSLSHVWMGEGGMLEMVDTAAKGLRGNSFAAWKEVRPHEKKFLEALTRTNIHIIATMRTKTEWVTDKDEKTGKSKPVKIGLKPEQREGLEYEFTTVLDMSVDGNVATVSKDRTDLFKGEFFVPSEETGRRLLEWLEEGKIVEPCTQDIPPFDLNAFKFDVVSCNDVEALRALYERNKLVISHQPNATEINHLVGKRRAELEKNPDGDQGEGKITDNQLKAIQAHYSNRKMEREKRLKDMSVFQGREVASFNDLTFNEAHAFIDAINQDKTGAQA